MTVSGTKGWKKSWTLYDVFSDAACAGPTTGNCNTPFTPENGSDNVQITAPIDTVRVYDIANPGTALPSCGGCAANRFLIGPGQTFRVFLSSRKLQALYPGAVGSQTGGYAWPYIDYFLYDINGTLYQLTGKYLGAFNFCVGTYTSGGTWRCPQTREYRSYLAITELKLTLTATDFEPHMAPAVTATANAHELTKHPVPKPQGTPTDYIWNPIESIPPN